MYKRQGYNCATPAPAPLRFFARKRVEAVACGWLHCVATTESGVAFAWGNNGFGQLGTGDEKPRKLPARVALPSGDGGPRLLKLACGAHFSLAVDASKKLWSWGRYQASNWPSKFADTWVNGYAKRGELGIKGEKIALLAGGESHMLASMESGKLFSWGYNEQLQLGIGDEKDGGQMKPREVKFKELTKENPVASLACGGLHTIVALKDEIDSGRGQYRRSRFRNAHIIVLGGAVTSGSATLQIFLEELLHPSRPNSSLPDVVLMSEEEPGTGLRRVLTSSLGQAHVKFIRGSPMDQADLARADAANADMAFVLGNLSVQDHLTEAEDEDTILRASLLQRQLPGLPVRLLLLRSWAKEMARTAGINPLSCLTSGVLNHCRTALAVRCPGLPVLLTTMYSKLAGDWSQLPSSMMPWVREYFTSMRHDVYGAQIGAAFDGVPFLEAAARIYREHDVNLLAVQSSPENGGRLCPAGMIGGHLHILSEGDVVMCLGQDVKRVLRAVDSSSKHPEAWRARFHAVRTAAARTLRRPPPRSLHPRRAARWRRGAFRSIIGAAAWRARRVCGTPRAPCTRTWP